MRSAIVQTQYHFKLFVTGATARSSRAISTLKAICEEYLSGPCLLEVIDIYQQPEEARKERILAAPTVLRLLPAPVRRSTGDLSDPMRLLKRLGLSIPDHLTDGKAKIKKRPKLARSR